MEVGGRGGRGGLRESSRRNWKRRREGWVRTEQMGITNASSRRKEGWGWVLRGRCFFGQSRSISGCEAGSLGFEESRRRVELELTSLFFSSSLLSLLNFSQHILDNQPLGLYAVKKVAVGESHDYLIKFVLNPALTSSSTRFPPLSLSHQLTSTLPRLAWPIRVLREVQLLQTLRHENIGTFFSSSFQRRRVFLRSRCLPRPPRTNVSRLLQTVPKVTYHHAWIERTRFSRFVLLLLLRRRRVHSLSSADFSTFLQI